MGQSEIRQKISQLERNIAETERRKAEAERNIHQLEMLSASCKDYQAEFEFARTARRLRLKDFNQILGQARLVEAYDTVLDELLNGAEYIRVYDGMDMARAEISREIERQRQIINECNSQIAGFRSSISDCQRELARLEREARDARNRINNERRLYIWNGRVF